MNFLLIRRRCWYGIVGPVDGLASPSDLEGAGVIGVGPLVENEGDGVGPQVCAGQVGDVRGKACADTAVIEDRTGTPVMDNNPCGTCFCVEDFVDLLEF